MVLGSFSDTCFTRCKQNGTIECLGKDKCICKLGFDAEWKCECMLYNAFLIFRFLITVERLHLANVDYVRSTHFTYQIVNILV